MDRLLAYLDASAFVKLFLLERESEALTIATDSWQLASSALLEVEAVRAVRRREPHEEPAVRAMLRGLELIDIDADIRHVAAGAADPNLRSLDAIHVATALSLGERCGTFFAYDQRLIAAARAHGLPVTVPQP